MALAAFIGRHWLWLWPVIGGGVVLAWALARRGGLGPAAMRAGGAVVLAELALYGVLYPLLDRLGLWSSGAWLGGVALLGFALTLMAWAMIGAIGARSPNARS